MTQLTANLANILENDSGIDAAYKHAPKHVTPGDVLQASPAGVKLNWVAALCGLSPKK